MESRVLPETSAVPVIQDHLANLERPVWKDRKETQARPVPPVISDKPVRKDQQVIEAYQDYPDPPDRQVLEDCVDHQENPVRSLRGVLLVV